MFNFFISISITWYFLFHGEGKEVHHHHHYHHQNDSNNHNNPTSFPTPLGQSDERMIGISSFLSIYEAFAPICNNPEYNVVIPRHALYDGLYDYTIFNCSEAWRRPWSIESNAIFTILGINRKQSNYAIDQSKPLCQSMEDIENSISNRMSEQTCAIHWFSPAQICNIFTKFSTVWWHGDSLARHLTQGLFVLMSGDFEFGGYPPSVKPLLSKNSPCRCDGQFAEILQCRDAQFLAPLQRIERFSRFGLCVSKIADREISFLWTQFIFENNHIQCPKNDRTSSSSSSMALGNYDRVFVFIEGGAHFDCNSTKAITTHFRPLIDQIYSDLRFCLSKSTVVFSGMVAVNQNHQKRSPGMNQNVTLKYNYDMKVWFQGKDFATTYPGLKVHILDFWNITSENIKYTSDGFHSLSSVNLIKAAVLLNMMYFVA